MKSAAKCFTIPADRPFLSVLARGILEVHGKDAAQLTRVLVLLPNRRACRSLRQAFLDSTGGQPMLLPRIQPIGDIDEEAPARYFIQHGETIPPPIPRLQRELLLARLVMRFDPAAGIEQALELARQLARFIDDTAREGLGLDGLSALVPQELAGHWQQTLDFLTIISQQWPRILADMGMIDPVDHRNRLLKATAAYWRAHPPETPVIAAGSTGSQPATAELLATIAKLPQGVVVLPGLDLEMREAEWDMVGETHPQFGLRHLLERMDCSRNDVQTLLPLKGRGRMGGSLQSGQADRDPHLDPPPFRGRRIACLRAILSPPEATAGWMGTALPLEEGLRGMRLVTADTQLDEARLIAVALREALETPGKTAALVTPDRALARMVAAQMLRFGITVDDSGGHRLANTPPGCFLRLAAQMAQTQAGPSELLALLRHPLAAGGMESARCRRLSRQLEIGLLRGPRREGGLAGLADAAAPGALKTWLAQLEMHVRPLTDLLARPERLPLADLLSAHLAFAEWLASTDREEGTVRLWAGETGAAMAEFLAELMAYADTLAEVDAPSYPPLFETLLAGQVWRPRYGRHPRLHILSPIEARLLQFDRVILGGLNEGTWPPMPPTDPWMSRPMRADFGLPSPERGIGQSAHDVMMLASAPEVILSRSRKVEGTPAVASRWLVRLETLLSGLDEERYAGMQAGEWYGQGRERLDAPLALPHLASPRPAPPLDARPRRMSVTAVDDWLRDPYAIYARYVLKLKALDPIDQEPDAAAFGELVHGALERFAAAYPETLPERPLEALLACGRAAFSAFIDRPAIAILWWPRFAAMAEWLVERERERRLPTARVLGELKGKWSFDVDGRPFTLTARIDRLEIGHDGMISIVDYKTGGVPSVSAVERGEANQLPLGALVALHGEIQPPLPKLHGVVAMEYWKLGGTVEQCMIRPVGGEDTAGLLDAAKERLEKQVRHFDDETTAYTAQVSGPRLPYNPYEHLTRRQEWEEI